MQLSPVPTTFDTPPTSSNHIRYAYVAVLLALFGCADFGGAPDGPLIHPTDAIDGTVERLLVTDGEIGHESVEFSTILTTPNTMVVVDFWANWCGPCKMLSPELERVAVIRKDDVIVVKVNVDQQPELAQHFEVGAIPDMAVFQNGKAIDRMIGFRNADQILSRLQRLSDRSVADR